MAIKRITCASMASTDGTITHYGIYQANLHFNLAGGKPYINFRRDTKHIATVTKTNTHWHNDELVERYLEMARPYAHPLMPAFTFTECSRCYGTDPECHCKPRNPTFTDRTTRSQTETQQ